MCREAGIQFDPTWARSTLIKALYGAVETERQHPIDNLRDGLMAYLIERRATLAAQLSCPASSFDPKACYSCNDLMPLFCTLQQKPETQQLIQLKRKPI